MIWAATLTANLGALVQNVAAAWLMAALTPSHGMVALVQTSTVLPFMVLAIAAGAIADNFDRRVVMLAAQCFMAVVSALLAVASGLGWLTPWTLLAFTFLLGLGAAMHLPAWQSSMRDLVPREDLASAVTMNAMSYNLMRAIGPAMGGVLVASQGPTVAFAFNAVCYLGLIVVLLLWKARREIPLLPAERLGSAIAAGLRYVALSPNLIQILLRGAMFGVAAVGVLALLPVVVRDVLQSEASVFGVLLGGFGLGGILGALASVWVRRKATLETVVAAAFVLSAVSCVLIAFATWVPQAMVGAILAGFAWVSALSVFNASIQLAAPRWVLGRALSIYQTTAFGGMALGSWLWGEISAVSSPRTALLVSAGGLVAGALIGRLSRMPEFSDADLEPANRFREPALRLELKARSGPILVMIDWRIAEKDVDDFLALMVERRRIRRRDGGRQWALLRDLEHPEVWVESYHVATWIDYVRHNHRPTNADTANMDRLLALHSGDGPPLVHRMIERYSVPEREDLRLIAPQ
ncbi:MAG: MFS transporter [Paracoccus sp. BP8]|nr:MAG: MFS transporter [Paracoccus sp. BP8]